MYGPTVVSKYMNVYIQWVLLEFSCRVRRAANSWWMKTAARNTHQVVTKYGDELGKQAAVRLCSCVGTW